MKTRGVIWIVWKGDFDPASALSRSLASIKHWHPELPYKVIEMPAGSNLLCKSQMYDLSPFDETLFLDADTTVLGKLDYGFAKAQDHGIACCINANPWQRRYHKLSHEHPDAVEYSSGVVFFDKNWDLDYCRNYDLDKTISAEDVFKRWNSLNDIDTSCLYQADDGVKRAEFNDQALFTLAMQQMGFNPFVLPLNWNLHPKWQKHFWGPVKIWHGCDDIPPALLTWNQQQSEPGAVIKIAGLP